MKIQIIVGSIRQGRATPRVAKWVSKIAKQTIGDVELEIVDLADYTLPLFDEPLPPLANQNRQPTESARRWLDKLAEADGYVFVTPEYNHGMPASLKNAVDYIDTQLRRKPVMIVSHGAVGGARSSEQLAQVLRSNVGAVPIPESVTIVGMVGFSNLISEEGEALEDVAKSAEGALGSAVDSLVWYAKSLSAKA